MGNLDTALGNEPTAGTPDGASPPGTAVTPDTVVSFLGLADAAETAAEDEEAGREARPGERPSEVAEAMFRWSRRGRWVSILLVVFALVATGAWLVTLPSGQAQPPARPPAQPAAQQPARPPDQQPAPPAQQPAQPEQPPAAANPQECTAPSGAVTVTVSDVRTDEGTGPNTGGYDVTWQLALVNSSSEPLVIALRTVEYESARHYTGDRGNTPPPLVGFAAPKVWQATDEWGTIPPGGRLAFSSELVYWAQDGQFYQHYVDAFVAFRTSGACANTSFDSGVALDQLATSLASQVQWP